MIAFDATQYGPVIAAFLSPRRLNDLGPGSPNQPVRSLLETFNLDQAFGHRKILDWDHAAACWAGLWLLHDFLDESHRVSQSIKTPSGSYWHGVMHRREPDYGNAKYWFARVGPHAVYAELHPDAARLAAEADADVSTAFLKTQRLWDAAAFIDLCETCADGSAPAELLCRRIQRREWELLFDYCYHRAVGETWPPLESKP